MPRSGSHSVGPPQTHPEHITDASSVCFIVFEFPGRVSYHFGLHLQLMTTLVPLRRVLVGTFGGHSSVCIDSRIPAVRGILRLQDSGGPPFGSLQGDCGDGRVASYFVTQCVHVPRPPSGSHLSPRSEYTQHSPCYFLALVTLAVLQAERQKPSGSPPAPNPVPEVRRRESNRRMRQLLFW